MEGLMALHVPAIRERLDLRLFLELDAHRRALRHPLRGMKRYLLGALLAREH